MGRGDSVGEVGASVVASVVEMFPDVGIAVVVVVVVVVAVVVDTVVFGMVWLLVVTSVELVVLALMVLADRNNPKQNKIHISIETIKLLVKMNSVACLRKY